jgi:hypothetical protein
MKEIRIVAIMISDRIKEAGRTQMILSKYAHIIKSRLGFHEVSEYKCSRVGMIILQLAGNPEEWDKMENELKNIGGIEIKHICFNC